MVGPPAVAASPVGAWTRGAKRVEDARERAFAARLCPSYKRLPAAEGALDRLKRRLGFGAIGAAGLRHVGFPAAALAAQDLGGPAHQIDGREPRHEIRRHADDDAGLAVRGAGDKSNDAGPKLFLALVREALQILDFDALDHAGQELHVADHAHAIGAIAARAATHGELLLRLRQLALE